MGGGDGGFFLYREMGKDICTFFALILVQRIVNEKCVCMKLLVRKKIELRYNVGQAGKLS